MHNSAFVFGCTAQEPAGRGYTARLQLLDGEREKLGDAALLHGMPAETMISTGDRSMLSCLVKPIRDQIAHALREE